MNGFHTVVSSEEVAAHLNDPRWVTFDCRHSLADAEAGRASYAQAHLPGTYFADVECDLSGPKTGTNGRHPLPGPETFASFLRSCGVSDDTQIVAYDEGADIFAARLWFLARWIGHDDVAVLDGGIRKWRDEMRPVSATSPKPVAAGTLRVALRPELVVDAAFVMEHLADSSVCIVDARSSDRFAGENETIDAIAGHIPTARNRWFKDNFATAGTLKSPEELRARFEPLGEPRSIVHQCGSGISAAANMFAMEAAGIHGSRLYAGSWSEWIADPARPVATGPA